MEVEDSTPLKSTGDEASMDIEKKNQQEDSPGKKKKRKSEQESM